MDVTEADVIVVSGGLRSTINVIEAGVVSLLPALSIALTSNVWIPSANVLLYGFEAETHPVPFILTS